MITPNNGPLVTPPATPQTYSGVWIQNLIISAPSITSPIRVNAKLIPFDPISGSFAPSAYERNISIKDVVSASINSPEISVAMNAIFTAIQGQVISQSIF